MAIWAFVLVLVLGALGALAGVPMAFVARSRIRASNGALKGSGLALAALIIGFAYFALVILAVAIPTFLGVTHARSDRASAAAIGLKASDLGPGFTAVGTDPPTTHSTPAPCTPVSSKPWTAWVTSPEYGSVARQMTVSSDVVVMPTDGDAQAAVSALVAPDYGTDCFMPNANASVADGLNDTASTCALNLEDPAIVHLTVPTTAGALPGYHYSAVITCGETGETRPYGMDIVFQAVGRVFVQAWFRSVGTDPTPAFEAQAMQSMIERATAANR